MTYEVLKLNKDSNEFLRKPCVDVETYGEELTVVTKNMVETMVSFNGAGLAAPQVGIGQNLFVMLSPESLLEGTYENTLTIVNPKLIEVSNEMDSDYEACLSIPGYVGQVMRHRELKVEYSDVFGSKFELALEGFAARVFQHEYDHLLGILYINKCRDLRFI